MRQVSAQGWVQQGVQQIRGSHGPGPAHHEGRLPGHRQPAGRQPPWQSWPVRMRCRCGPVRSRSQPARRSASAHPQQTATRTTSCTPRLATPLRNRCRPGAGGYPASAAGGSRGRPECRLVSFQDRGQVIRGRLPRDGNRARISGVLATEGRASPDRREAPGSRTAAAVPSLSRSRTTVACPAASRACLRRVPSPSPCRRSGRRRGVIPIAARPPPYRVSPARAGQPVHRPARRYSNRSRSGQRARDHFRPSGLQERSRQSATPLAWSAGPRRRSRGAACGHRWRARSSVRGRFAGPARSVPRASLPASSLQRAGGGRRPRGLARNAGPPGQVHRDQGGGEPASAAPGGRGSRRSW